MPIANKLEKMTKEEIYHCVKKSGCRMLSGLRLLHLKKDDMIEYLEKKKCPELERLIHASQKQKE
jgi:ribosomal protein L11 methylase PrmA